MSKNLISFCLLIFMCITALATKHKGRKPWSKARIIGGKRAVDTQFPFVVAIIITENEEEFPFRCTGSLITLSWVITAAHCYRGIDTDQEQGSRIVAGSVVSDRHLKSTQVRYSKRFVVHEKANNRGTFDMDVALVEVTDPFELNAYVNPIIIARGPFPTDIGVTCSSIGYGKTDDEDKDRNALLNYMDVVAGDNAYCNKLKGGMHSREESVCITPVKEDSATCSGDSGGPLVCQGRLAATLAGTAGVAVINGTLICTDPDGVTVEMFTGYFEKWIRQYIPNLPISNLLTGDTPFPAIRPRYDSDEVDLDDNQIDSETTKPQRNSVEIKPEDSKPTTSASRSPRGREPQLDYMGIVIVPATFYILY